MAIIDVVKWDGTPDIFAWKHPEENLTTFTQLIVHQTQEAVLFHKGKLLSVFGAGKHTLSTENIPILENLFGIPFGGKNPFTAEVWFVNKIYSLDIKWGTKAPIQVLDPVFKVMIPVRSHGQFGIRIADSEKFLLKLVGTLHSFDKNRLSEYFKGLMLTKITTALAKAIIQGKTSILEIAPHIEELSITLQNDQQKHFEDFGVELVNFFIHNISVPEDDPSVSHLKTLLSRKTEMDMLGYNYQQERSFDVLDKAAKNEGSASGAMGLGLGLGMGIGGGKAVGNMMGNLANELNAESVKCPKCTTTNLPGSKFCSSCGEHMSAMNSAATEETVVNCDKCSNIIPKGAKFCPHCGDIYNACPNCDADLPDDTSACTFCGEILPKDCPVCNHKIISSAKFCPECGTSLAKKCAKCGTDISNGEAFCKECGEKVK